MRGHPILSSGGTVLYFSRRVLRVSVLILILVCLETGCSSWLDQGSYYEPVSRIEPIPEPRREFRGVWLATVVNIDWPSARDLSAEAQQAELRAILDRVAGLNMNAVVFQVRPAADAMYQSDLEPWSEYLTGSMGNPPQPYYDPLAFAVQEAHKRGLELHAWFNPFRARHASGRGPATANHVSIKRPDMVVQYGDQLWLDPGHPEAQFHTLRVIHDVVSRYDIDGVHIDDYFYPYPVKDKQGKIVEFPDDKSWAQAREITGALDRDDWRRENINRFVERLYETVKAEKPWVKVGISPFGIWRPGNPQPIRGLDAYQSLYADSRLWLQNGWLDYMSPQLYWSIDSAGQSFTSLYEWWEAQNIQKRYVWPGSAIYRLDSHGWKEKEILDQIRFTRNESQNSGNILFSMRVLDQTSHRLADRLYQEVYDEPALIPEMPWLSHPDPGKPSVQVEQSSSDRVTVKIGTYSPERVRQWVIRARYGERWRLAIAPGESLTYQLPASLNRLPIQEIAVSAVSRVGQESVVERVQLTAPSSSPALGF